MVHCLFLFVFVFPVLVGTSDHQLVQLNMPRLSNPKTLPSAMDPTVTVLVQPPAAEISCLAAHPQNPEVVIGSVDQTVTIWSCHTHTRLSAAGPVFYPAPVSAISIDASGQRVAVGLANGQVYVVPYDSLLNSTDIGVRVTVLKRQSAFSVDGDDDPADADGAAITALRFTPAGSAECLLAIGTLAHTVWVVRVGASSKSAASLLHVWDGHSSAVTSLDFDTHGGVLQSVGTSLDMIYWNVTTGFRMAPTSVDVATAIWASWTSPVGWPVQALMVGGTTGGSGTAGNATGTIRSEYYRTGTLTVRSCARSAGGSLLAAGDESGDVIFRQFPAIHRLGRARVHTTASASVPTTVTFTAQDQYLVVGLAHSTALSPPAVLLSYRLQHPDQPASRKVPVVAASSAVAAHPNASSPARASPLPRKADSSDIDDLHDLDRHTAAPVVVPMTAKRTVVDVTPSASTPVAAPLPDDVGGDDFDLDLSHPPDAVGGAASATVASTKSAAARKAGSGSGKSALAPVVSARGSTPAAMATGTRTFDAKKIYEAIQELKVKVCRADLDGVRPLKARGVRLTQTAVKLERELTLLTRTKAAASATGMDGGLDGLDAPGPLLSSRSTRSSQVAAGHRLSDEMLQLLGDDPHQTATLQQREQLLTENAKLKQSLSQAQQELDALQAGPGHKGPGAVVLDEAALLAHRIQKMALAKQATTDRTKMTMLQFQQSKYENELAQAHQELEARANQQVDQLTQNKAHLDRLRAECQELEVLYAKLKGTLQANAV